MSTMPAKKFASLLMGGESLLVQCAEALRARGHTIAAFVTQEESIRPWAKPLGIQVHAPGADLEKRLSGTRYDWYFGIANLRAVPQSVRQAAAKGAALFHDGPLPKHAGFNGPSWAILSGETQYGVTWHAPVGDDDTGDIYAQRLFDIDSGETALTLNTKCFEAGIETFAELLHAIEDGTLKPRPQDLSARSHHARHDRPIKPRTTARPCFTQRARPPVNSYKPCSTKSSAAS